MNFMPELSKGAKSTHGIELPQTGGGVKVDKNVDPEIAHAAFDKKQAVIVHEGSAYLAPMDAIDPDAVELACNNEGCALIPDDGNPHNDITLDQAKKHIPSHNDDWVAF